MKGVIRWGILGAASIARGQFLPGLREAGGGRPVLLGSRDLQRGEEFAAAEGIDRAVLGYDAVLSSGEIDAVYIALPNTHHAEWTIAAIEAGLAVLCEKPLTHEVAATDRVLGAARAAGDALLWEAFVFPFQAQHLRLLELLAAGAIGKPREVTSHFHFAVRSPDNIRLAAELGGGALADVGCYPVRLAHELLGPADGAVWVDARLDGDVETDAAAIVAHREARLILSCGFGRPYDTFTRVLGDAGEIRLSNPFHPGRGDTLELRIPGQEPVVEHPTVDERSFSAAIRHIHAVLRGEAPPRQLAIESAGATSRTLAALQSEVRA
jgi:predicted dehydrogenase